MSGVQAIFKLEIKKKSGLSGNPDIHHSKVFSSGYIFSAENQNIFSWIPGYINSVGNQDIFSWIPGYIYRAGYQDIFNGIPGYIFSAGY